MNYFCCTDIRRNAVLLYPTINGIDYLEVLDNATDPYNERQTTLFLHFIKPLVPNSLTVSNIIIEGGERIKNIKVIDVEPDMDDLFPSSPPTEAEKVLVVKVSKAGDFSTYTLRLIKDAQHDPPADFDVVLSSVDFSFKVACPTDFDCKPACDCPPEIVSIPEINYLAKDYGTFRQLMLDRMALLLPKWAERNPADQGIMLVELLAYSADYLSYQQDAIATEAYLGTARKRISVRRHARMVDYFMHDGCNARAWLHIQVGANVNGLILKKGEGDNITRILTRVKSLPTAIRLDAPEYGKALNGGAKVFELMHDKPLYTVHNEMEFYTWCGKACCLPKGATKATLRGSFPHLLPGDVLVFSEVLGPITGVSEDADPAHQHAVMLTKVTQSYDSLFDCIPMSPPMSPPLGSPPDGSFFNITEIEWSKMDALPFPICISNNKGIENISIALGNIVLVDHGLSVQDADESSLQPSQVPVSTMSYVGSEGGCCDFCDDNIATAIPARFNPKLSSSPLTFAAPFNAKPKSAAAQMSWSIRTPMPVISIDEVGIEGNIKGNPDWFPQRDLLNSASNAREFVVEIESDGTAFLRFGNDIQGAKPAEETSFMANYRIGNGASGNIGGKSLAHIATNDSDILANMEEKAAVWNPLAAQGGVDPETMEQVKQYAPQAFRTQERAVNAGDYEDFAKKCSADVQRAATTFRWTGSWKTVFLTVDRLGGSDVDTDFETGLSDCLEQYRMAGFDLDIDSPLFVSLEIEMTICVNPDFFASDVKQALLEVFSNHVLPDGTKGIFHPDNFTFGQTVYTSVLYAAAQAVQGVDSVKITTFQRQGMPDTKALSEGKLLLGRREIARLDNDRNYPEHGVFTLVMNGGRR